MNGRMESNYSFDSFVVAAENQSFKATESFYETQHDELDQSGDEDEYGLKCSAETLELLHGLSQKAREALDAEACEKEEAELDKMRSRAELEASQRLRGKAELDRNKLPPDVTTNRFRENEPVPMMVTIMQSIRKSVNTSPMGIDTGIRRFLQEFQQDELLCTRLALHFTSAIAKIFCTGIIPMVAGWPSPHDITLVWQQSYADSYPSLQSFELGHQKGRYPRGVYLLQLYKVVPGSPHQLTLNYYIGSGRSSQGGMLFRAVQHADPKHRERNITLHLYKNLNQPGARYRIYCLTDWPAIAEVPSTVDDFDEILLMEMLWQIRLRTGAKRKMSAFFEEVQGSFDGDVPITPKWGGLNVDSAIERPRRYAGSALRSFS